MVSSTLLSSTTLLVSVSDLQVSRCIFYKEQADKAETRILNSTCCEGGRFSIRNLVLVIQLFNYEQRVTSHVCAYKAIYLTFARETLALKD